MRVANERARSDVGESGIAQQTGQQLREEARMVLSHPDAKILVLVAEDVHDDDLPSTLDRARHLSQSGCDVGEVAEREDQERGVALGVGERQRLESALTQLDVVERLRAVPRGREHLGRLIDPDHAADVASQGFGDLARATPKIGDGPRRRKQVEKGDLREGVAVGLFAKSIPLARGAGKESPRGTAAAFEASRQPDPVLRGRWPPLGLLFGELPQLRRCVSVLLDHRVQVRRPLRAGLNEPALGQHLQVPAHGRLRQAQALDHVCDTQLSPIQEPQNAQTGGLGEALHPA